MSLYYSQCVAHCICESTNSFGQITFLFPGKAQPDSAFKSFGVRIGVTWDLKQIARCDFHIILL